MATQNLINMVVVFAVAGTILLGLLAPNIFETGNIRVLGVRNPDVRLAPPRAAIQLSTIAYQSRTDPIV
jgi:hypothetical protein